MVLSFKDLDGSSKSFIGGCIMVKKHFCDIPNCKEEAVRLDIDMCTGYTLGTQNEDRSFKYEPFERPEVVKCDLCKKHFKAWCKATYTIALFEVKQNDI